MNNTPEQNPVCPGCGERHPVNPKQALDVALLELATEVDKALAIIDPSDPSFDPLRKASKAAQKAAQVLVEGMLATMQAQQFQRPATGKPSPSGSTGFYL